jgi:hypothetical protein
MNSKASALAIIASWADAELAMTIAATSWYIRRRCVDEVTLTCVAVSGWDAFYEHPLLRWTEEGITKVFKSCEHRITDEDLRHMLNLWLFLADTASDVQAARHARRLWVSARLLGKCIQPTL